MEQIQATIIELDLGHVTQRMQDRGGYEQSAAVAATDLYRKFLYLKVKYPNDTLVGPRLVDEAWHEHILSTEAYMKDCDKVFGCYVHHNPNIESERHKLGWARTKELFASEFGLDLDKSTIEGLQVAGHSA